MDNLTKEQLNANVTDFMTGGSMNWYGIISSLPEECMEDEKYDKNRNKRRVINTLLYRLEYKEY